MERPDGLSGPYPLADFGTTSFSSCTAKIGTHSGPIGGFPLVGKITMVGNNGATVIASVSALTSKTAFTVKWKGYQ